MNLKAISITPFGVQVLLIRFVRDDAGHFGIIIPSRGPGIRPEGPIGMQGWLLFEISVRSGTCPHARWRFDVIGPMPVGGGGGATSLRESITDFHCTFLALAELLASHRVCFPYVLASLFPASRLAAAAGGDLFL